GVRFRTSADVGVSPTVEDLRRKFDAICVAVGAEVPRDLQVPGRVLSGIELAMTFLAQQNRRDAGDHVDPGEAIDAGGKHVVIIGGGDTGSDCAGTCLRQGARSVKQFELLPQPPASRAESTPWPFWPMQLRTSHAHEEGTERAWSVATTSFSGENGRVQRIHGVRLDTQVPADGRANFVPIAGTEFELEADLVLLAMGFTGPVKSKLLADLGVGFDSRGNVATANAHFTRVPGVFAAGDARRGASLIVW